MFLIVPFGAMGGYLSVAIGYQLTQAGVSVEQVAELVAFSYIPQTWKFLWAPVADTTLTRKTWYILAGLVSAVGIFVTGVVPADERSLPLLYAAVLVSNVAVTFLAMASESLMIYNTPPELPAAPAAVQSAISAETAWAAGQGCGSRRPCPSRGWPAPHWQWRAPSAARRCGSCPNRRRCRVPATTVACWSRC
jgi:hypothetical protein